MRKTLCPRCLQSVATAALVDHGGQRICVVCVRATTSGRPASVPIEPGSGAPATFRERLIEDVRDWCTGRVWWIRVPILLYLAYVGFRYAVQPLHPPATECYVSWFDGINLGFHELGHVVFRPLGRFLHILGGTLLQCIMPCLAGFFLLRWRDYFGLVFCVGWLSTNLSGVAIYMADAQLRQLPLVAPGIGRVDANYHDWWNLFTMMGLLEQTDTLATLLKVAAAFTMALTLALGGWICWTMACRPGTLGYGRTSTPD